MVKHAIPRTVWLYPPTWAGFLYGLWQERRSLWISHGRPIWYWTKGILVLLGIFGMLLSALGMAIHGLYTILTFAP